MSRSAAGGASLARLQVLLAAALFSTGGAAIKAIGLSSWQVASMRSGIAAVALLCLAREARLGLSLRHGIPARTWFVSLAYAATVLLFVTATKLTTSANAIFLQSTAPLYILLASPWLLRERIARADVVFMLVVGAGLALFFVDPEAPRGTAPDPAAGNLVALASGVSFAVLVMGMRRMGAAADDVATPDAPAAEHGVSTAVPGRAVPRGSALSCVVLGNVLAFGIGLPFALPVAASGTDWLLLVFLGLVQIGLAYVLLTRGLAHVKAFEASVLLLIEPALNPVWSWAVHGERPGLYALLGGGLILGATLCKAWRDAR